MKYYFFILFILFTSCKKDVPPTIVDTNTNPTTGIGSGSGTTTVVYNGNIKLVASWQVNYPFTLCIIPFKATVGISYTSAQANSNTFFSSKVYKESIPIISGGVTIGQNATLEVKDLKPGVYYYKAIKESNSCTVKGQTAKTVEKTGSFTIKSLETILVNVNLN